MAHCFIFRFAIAVGQNNPSDFVMQKKNAFVLCCVVWWCGAYCSLMISMSWAHESSAGKLKNRQSREHKFPWTQNGRPSQSIPTVAVAVSWHFRSDDPTSALLHGRKTEPHAGSNGFFGLLLLIAAHKLRCKRFTNYARGNMTETPLFNASLHAIIVSYYMPVLLSSDPAGVRWSTDSWNERVASEWWASLPRRIECETVRACDTRANDSNIFSVNWCIYCISHSCAPCFVARICSSWKLPLFRH